MAAIDRRNAGPNASASRGSRVPARRIARSAARWGLQRVVAAHHDVEQPVARRLLGIGRRGVPASTAASMRAMKAAASATLSG